MYIVYCMSIIFTTFTTGYIYILIIYRFYYTLKGPMRFDVFHQGCFGEDDPRRSSAAPEADHRRSRQRRSGIHGAVGHRGFAFCCHEGRGVGWFGPVDWPAISFISILSRLMNMLSMLSFQHDFIVFRFSRK